MASKRSAGILLYRRREAGAQVLLVHPGGPFWSKKDLGAWFIPKGELEDGEDPLAAARREFFEELGSEPPGSEPLELGFDQILVGGRDERSNWSGRRAPGNSAISRRSIAQASSR